VCPPKPCMQFSPLPCSQMPFPSHPPWFVHPNLIGWGVKSWSSSLYNSLQLPATSSTWVPIFSLSILLSNTLSLCFHTGVRDQVSHPYTTTGKTVIFIFMVFRYRQGRWKIPKCMLEAFHTFCQVFTAGFLFCGATTKTT
jgi:hypothetical protein